MSKMMESGPSSNCDTDVTDVRNSDSGIRAVHELMVTSKISVSIVYGHLGHVPCE